MAKPLPYGYVDTGVATSVTVSGSASISNIPLTQTGIGDTLGRYNSASIIAELGEWDLAGVGEFNSCLSPQDDDASAERIIVLVGGPQYFEPVQLEFREKTCAQVNGGKEHPDGSSGAYHYTETQGPFRLGMRFSSLASNAYPQFATHAQVEFAWFSDGYTKRETTFAGHSALTLYATGTSSRTLHPNPDVEPFFAPILGGLNFGGRGYPEDKTYVTLSGLTTNGWVVDTSELETPPLKGTGGGGATVKGPGGSLANASAPYIFAFDINIGKFNGLDSLAAEIIDDWLTQPQLNPDFTQKTPQADSFLANSSTPQYLVPVVSWPIKQKTFNGSNSFRIRPSWAADYKVFGQSFPLRTDDQQIPLDVAAPRLHTMGAAAGYFQPLTVNVIPTLSVHRPDGADDPPSIWVSSDTDKLDVAENDDTSVFVVDITGAHVTRTLMHHWRAWLAAAPTSHDMLVRYPRTKHNLYLSETPTQPEDIWAWDTYGWAQISIAAPASGTLQLTVSGVYLSVMDPFLTDFEDRVAGFSSSEDPFSFTYDLPLVSGANTLWVDLLFPDVRDPVGSGPVAVSRVDTLKLSGFGVGTYTLSQFDLKVREQGYVKCDFGPPVQRGDYDALVISQDGAQCLGNIPDQMNKTEVGKSGGGIRYVNIIESTVLNPPVIDNQFDLKTFWEKLNDIEGFTVTWSQSAADAAVKDGEGNSMGAGMAQWTRPGSGHVPYDRFVNNQYQPKCSPRAGTIKIPNGRSFTFYADWNYGYGALETLAATTEDERAPEGTPVAALWVDGGVEVAAGLTDASGYAVVPGVPANGTETFQLQQG